MRSTGKATALCALWLACAAACDPRESVSWPAAAKSAPSAAQRTHGSVEEATEVRRVYYQFVDASGAVRFVPTLDAVPAEWRSRVGFVEMSSPPPLTPADAQRIRDARAQRAVARSQGENAPASAPERSSGSAPLILYGAEWCGVCRMAKDYMDGKGIAYAERNVDEPRWHDEMQAKAGPGGIPVFDIGGQILRGFSPQMLDEALRSAP